MTFGRSVPTQAIHYMMTPSQSRTKLLSQLQMDHPPPSSCDEYPKAIHSIFPLSLSLYHYQIKLDLVRCRIIVIRFCLKKPKDHTKFMCSDVQSRRRRRPHEDYISFNCFCSVLLMLRGAQFENGKSRGFNDKPGCFSRALWRII